jgi:hypothetical protein
MAVEHLLAVGTSGLGGAVGVEGELPAAAVDADVVVVLALCGVSGYADVFRALAVEGWVWCW